MMKKVLGCLLGAVVALGAGIVFSAFGVSKLVSLDLDGLTTLLSHLLFLAGGIAALRPLIARVFRRGQP